MLHSMLSSITEDLSTPLKENNKMFEIMHNANILNQWKEAGTPSFAMFY